MKLIIPALRIRRTTRFLMSGTTTLTATRMTWVPVVAWFSHISEPGPNTIAQEESYLSDLDRSLTGLSGGSVDDSFKDDGEYPALIQRTIALTVLWADRGGASHGIGSQGNRVGFYRRGRPRVLAGCSSRSELG